MLHRLILISCAALLLASNALAQVPETVGYTGFLMNDNGPVDGVVDIDVSLHDKPTGDDVLWEESHEAVEVEAGWFTLSLGRETELDVGALSDDTLYVEIAVDGETLSPRSAFEAVPYARIAADSTNLGGVFVGADQVVDADGGWTGAQIDADDVDLSDVLERLDALEAIDHAGMTERIAALEAQIATLEAVNAELSEALDDAGLASPSDLFAPMAELVDVVGLTADEVGRPTVRFEGVNVQIVDGSGTTFCGEASDSGTPGAYPADVSASCYDAITEEPFEETAGLGNLIIGYNGETSWGDVDPSAPNYRSGTHNLVMGDGNDYLSYGGLVAGSENRVDAAYATVAGGTHNLAEGPHSSILSGERAYVTGESAAIVGGNRNRAEGRWASVGGGSDNQATGAGTAIAGGSLNQATGQNSVVAGGGSNTASGNMSFVGGGQINVASGVQSTSVGGEANTASHSRSVVTGGHDVSSCGDRSLNAELAQECDL